MIEIREGFIQETGMRPREWLELWNKDEIPDTFDNNVLASLARVFRTSLKVFLDDERTPSQIYGDGANDEWVVVSTASEVIDLLKCGCVSHLSLDNDLGEDIPEGHVLIPWMINNEIWPREELWVHSANPYWNKLMKHDIERFYYGCVESQWERNLQEDKESEVE